MDDATVEAAIVKALRPYDIPTGRSWSDVERVEPARAVMAALAALPGHGYFRPEAGDPE